MTKRGEGGLGSTSAVPRRSACATWLQFVGRLAVVTGLTVLSIGPPAHARTWTMAHSGGDVDSLAKACRLAAAGDTIQIEPGRYEVDQGFAPKPFTLVRNKPLVIRGSRSQGPEVTLVSHRLFFQDCPNVVIEDIRFEAGEAVLVSGQAMSIYRCEFANIGYGAVEIGDDAVGESRVDECLFSGNNRQTIGAGLAVYGRAEITRCVFKGNSATSESGALRASAWAHIAFCTFVGNEAPDGAAIAIVLGSGGRENGSIENCTFYRNRVLTPGGAALYVQSYGGPAPVDRCVFAETVGGLGLFCDGGVSNQCSLFWNNEGGNAGPGLWCEPIGGEIADPLFCDPTGGDFRVKTGSPCLPGNYTPNPECGLIGALGEVCTVSAVARVSWGKVKARYGSRE